MLIRRSVRTVHTGRVKRYYYTLDSIGIVNVGNVSVDNGLMMKMMIDIHICCTAWYL